jgi:multiple sugar transport system substrate-binding protein
MKNKKLFSLIASITLLGGLCSCGETSASVNSASSTGSSSGTVQIEFWHTFGKTVTAAFEEKIKDFTALVKKNEGVDVSIKMTYQGGYDDLLEKVHKGFSTGNYPNIAIAYPDHVAQYLKDEGSNAGKYVVDLSSYINSDEYGFGKESYLGDGAASDFVDAFYNEGKSYARSGIYSLPVMKSSEVLFYNKTQVAKYASQYDSSLNSDAKVEKFMATLTWDKFMDFCRFIKNKISSIEVPLIYDSDSNLFITKCYQNDIDFLSINDDGQGQVLFNNQKAKDMVSSLKSLYDEGLIATKGTYGTYSSEKFTNEKCIFTVGSTGGAGYNYPTGNSFTVGVAPVPYDGKQTYVTQGLTATVLKYKDDDGKKSLYSYKFLKYITSAEVNADLCINGSEGYSPVRKSAYETDMYQEYLANEDDDFMPKVAKIVYEDIDGKYFTTPCFSGSATARDQVGGILTQVFTGDKTIDKAFEDAENQTKLAM